MLILLFILYALRGGLGLPLFFSCIIWYEYHTKIKWIFVPDGTVCRFEGTICSLLVYITINDFTKSILDILTNGVYTVISILT